MEVHYDTWMEYFKVFLAWLILVLYLIFIVQKIEKRHFNKMIVKDA